MTLSFSLIGWRGLAVTNIFIGNFFFVFFYGGFGAILTHPFKVKESYSDDIVGYNNGLGLWVLMDSACYVWCSGYFSIHTF
ncbi:hypothetical protein LOCC1_G005262 [Lachnellula occidentalis]|uniref:Uncharacterized protein n=1 Tax=Lachnellula occidentalis TaxID=215460 RepID=A0A8H8UER8_9HELO|nr:hypothetical protein LOCC1_G005262 [Lachnellula occidentalis]